MKKLIKFALGVIVLILPFKLLGQSDYLVFRIDKKNSNNKASSDYWIAPLGVNEKIHNNTLIPLFIDGFSESDFNECLGDSLIVFNFYKDESFAFDETFVKEIINLKSIINTKGVFFQKITKKWSDNRKEVLHVFVVPIKGEFILCQIRHAKGATYERLGYEGTVAMPNGAFSYSKQPGDKIKNIDIDISQIPWIGLHFLQWDPFFK